MDSSKSLNRRATGSIPSLVSNFTETKNPKNIELHPTFKSKRHLSEDEGKQVGKRMKLRTPNIFSWSCLSLQEAKGPRAASTVEGGGMVLHMA